MPELPVKEVRSSELHLPEIKRDDIVRSLSEMHLPSLDLTGLERPRIDLPDRIKKVEWPRIDLSTLDVGKALAGAAAAVHIGRRARRPRWPLAVGGLLVAGLAVLAIVRTETVRGRIATGMSALRERLVSMRADEPDRLEVDLDQPVAFDSAETAPIQASPFSDGMTTVEATGYPEGLGSRNGDGSPAPEETAGSR